MATDFPRIPVSEATKIGSLYSGLAKEAFTSTKK